eukprot:9424849-Pyramimonas_sp.AAC.1
MNLHCLIDQTFVGDRNTFLDRVHLVLEGDALRHPDVALDETRCRTLASGGVCSGEIPLDVVATHGGADKVTGESAFLVGDEEGWWAEDAHPCLYEC